MFSRACARKHGSPHGAAMGLGKLIACVLVLWLLVVLMISGPLFHNNEPDEQVLARLTRAVGELESLKQQNDELRSLLNAIKEPGRKEAPRPQQQPPPPSGSSSSAGGCEPSEEYEVRRRRVANGVQEQWFYARAQLRKLLPGLSKEAQDSLQRIIDSLAVYRRTIQLDLEAMRAADGYDGWRRAESRALSELVQERLSRLQHPEDCGRARKLVCNLNKGCGYGCQVHHATYCLIVAYATRRTLVLNSKGWRYAAGGWETVFRPVSNSCTEAAAEGVHWGSHGDASAVVELPIIDSMQPRPAFLPLAVPAELAPRLVRLHGDPALWWVSHVLGFLVRPQASLRGFLERAARDMGFRGPVVGVHVRRTDKVGTEAAFHPLEEYMEWVDDYFDRLALRGDPAPLQRRVYLATDEPKLLDEARTKYPSYQFFGDSRIAKTASLGQRYSSESLRGVLLDIHMLSRCDFLVCTFSSQVCRLAYELLQLSHVDASERFRSLDDVYYFGGQNAHNQRALYNHTAQSPQEIDVRVGDTLGIAGNHWDGFSKGVNRRTGRQGLYPAFKAVHKLNAVPFPP